MTGVPNPFSALNPDEICCMEVETNPPLPPSLPKNIDRIHKLTGPEEYEAMPARQWPRRMGFRKNKEGDLFEALIELSLRNGESVFPHATCRASPTSKPVEAFFHPPAIMASYPPSDTPYVDARCIARSGVYHSRRKLDYPEGLWFAEADDV